MGVEGADRYNYLRVKIAGEKIRVSEDQVRYKQICWMLVALPSKFRCSTWVGNNLSVERMHKLLLRCVNTDRLTLLRFCEAQWTLETQINWKS